MIRNVTKLFSEKRISALLAAASVGVLIIATTSAEAYARRGGAGVGRVGGAGVGVGRVGSGVGYRPGLGVGRAGVGVAGWRGGPGYGDGRYGYGGLGYGAAALTGAALGYGAANAYGYGYPAGDAANTALTSAPVAATTSGDYYGGSQYVGFGAWNGYGIIKCQPGTTIQMEDGQLYLCQ